MSTPQHLIGECAKICYSTKAIEDGGKDITGTMVHNYKHLSSLRFAYATIHLEGISVACQNQIVRSSHLDFMVQSKRYVNADKGEFEFIMPEGLDESTQRRMQEKFDASLFAYRDMVANGVKKEDARAILPANTSTKMYMTGNLQGFMSFFNLRLNRKAQTEIRNVANAIYDLLAIEYPLVFTPKLREELSC